MNSMFVAAAPAERGVRQWNGDIMSYKEEIEGRVNLVFALPQVGIREYQLNISNNTGLADFCWNFGEHGRLFIEDEDDNSQRGLNNLIKYWRWCDQNPGPGPIVLIHVLGKENILNVQNIRFLGDRMVIALSEHQFYYRVVTGFVGNEQHNPNAEWLNKLEQILRGLDCFQSFRIS